MSSNSSNILLRSDGFKKIVKGLSYKANMQQQQKQTPSQSHSSLASRAKTRQYTIRPKNSQSGIIKQDHNAFRRTKTAVINREKNQNMEQLFDKFEKEQEACFKQICDKLLL